MTVVSVETGMDAFPMTRIEAKALRCIALFAVGRGGNPGRHLPLMQTMARKGCTVIAPHFEMLASIVPAKS